MLSLSKPAMVDKRHRAAFRLFADDSLGGALGPDEQHRTTVGDQTTDVVHGIAEQRQRRLEVDDMNFSAFAEDVGGHLRIPVSGLVTKVHASFEHLAHGDICHSIFSKFGLNIHAPHDSNPAVCLTGS